ALGSDAGVAELTAFVESHGIEATQVLELAEAGHDVPEPARVLGCIAPLQVGLRWVTLLPCSNGLAVLRPRGASEWVALGAAGIASGTARKFALLVLRSPIEDVLARTGAELLAWDEIASVRLAERLLRSELLTVTMRSGDTHRLKVIRLTDTYGDPWNPWEIVRHLLGERFVVTTLGTGRRTGSRTGVLEP
ncbi:MAG: hypothetical protein ABI873_19345, partial [Marmoricola sp.]